MFVRKLLLFVFLVSATGALRADGGIEIDSDNPWPACVSREHVEKLVDLSVSGDNEASARMLLALTIDGQCILLERGMRVFVTDASFFSGLVKIRPKGDFYEYWTVKEAVLKNR